MFQIKFNPKDLDYNYAAEFDYLDSLRQTDAVIKTRTDLICHIHMRDNPHDYMFRKNFLAELYRQKAYNPAQPRLPRGQTGAGEWVGDNGRRERTSPGAQSRNPCGNPVRLAASPQIYNPAVQSDAPPMSMPIPKPAPMSMPRGGGRVGLLIQGAIQLYNYLTSQQHSAGSAGILTGDTPVIVFESREYTIDSEANSKTLAYARTLTEAETLKACPRFAEVQSRLDIAIRFKGVSRFIVTEVRPKR
jgi:hypothetical protein